MYKFEWSVNVPTLFLVFRSFLKVYAVLQNEMQINRNSNCRKTKWAVSAIQKLLTFFVQKAALKDGALSR